MKNLKKIALTALAAVTTTVAPAQAGQVIDGYHIMDEADFATSKPHVRIVQALTALGIPVFDGGKNGFKQCEPRENGTYTLGFYNPKHNAMVLCTNNGDEATMKETLTHEAVHVLQDMRAGLDNVNLKTYETDINSFAKTLPERHVDLIVKLYPREQWAEEIEARALQTNPVMVGEILAKSARKRAIRAGKPVPTFVF